MDVAVIGFGRFGRAFVSLLEEAGHSVRAWDPVSAVPADRGMELADVAKAKFVVLAVPVVSMGEALAIVRRHLSPSQIVFDVGSVKVGPALAMRAALGTEIPWAATHPLFGPMSLAAAERPMRVVLCPAPEHPDAAARVRAIFESLECQVIEQTPEAHDRVMAHTHALTFFVAKGMLDAGAGMEVPFAPPSFQALARAIETVRSDAGHLFAAIANENPFAAEARKRLVEALTSLDHDLAEPRRELIAIPDLGERSFELEETREHIDAVDREIIGLLARRTELARRAGRAKRALGAPVLDAAREATVLDARGDWAREEGLEESAIHEIFRAIMKLARRVQ